MKSKNYTKHQPTVSKAEEPEILYERSLAGTELHVFHSFEEASSAKSETIVLQDPVQRLKDTVELILRAYGFTRESLKKRKAKNTITISQYD